MYACRGIGCWFRGEPLMVRNRSIEDWNRRVHNDHRPVELPECPECGSKEIELTDDREETEEAGEPIEVPSAGGCSVMSENKDWPTPSAIDKQALLYEALAKAQSEFPKIPRDKEVSVATKSGGKYTFSYAPLESILRSTMPVLAKNGLAVSQSEENGVLKTTLMHKDGGTLVGLVSIPVHDTGMQAHGSALTYSKRYGFSSLLCVCADDDDDGNQADGNQATDVSNKDCIAAAKRYREALDRESDPAIFTVHNELIANDALYQATWKMLDSKERRAIKDAVDRMRAGGPRVLPNGRAA